MHHIIKQTLSSLVITSVLSVAPAFAFAATTPAPTDTVSNKKVEMVDKTKTAYNRRAKKLFKSLRR